MRGCGRAILTLCAVPSRASTDSAQRAAEGQRAAGTAERRACSSWQLQRYATRKKAARVNGSGKSPGCPRGVLACSSPAGFRQGGKRGLVAANVTSLPTQLISITHIHIQLSTNGHFVYAFLILRLLVFSGSFDRYSRFRTAVRCGLYGLQKVCPPAGAAGGKAKPSTVKPNEQRRNERVDPRHDPRATTAPAGSATAFARIAM